MASAFSFHCMICFEEFHAETRYPVVLPCGHTYVCNRCAERLDKCMECRTPLCLVAPRPQNNNTTTIQHGRWPRTAPSTPPPPPVKKRLPLPKNVVLLSLIEATELVAEDVNSSQERNPSDSPVIKSSYSLLDCDDEEEEKIKAGTSLAVSDCGTYAVAAPQGLDIYPSRPTAGQSLLDQSEEDVDTLVRFFHLEHKLEAGNGTNNMEADCSTRTALGPPARLSCGDRVQIVAIDSNWAKLARGYGFVRAEGQQLVKVSGSMDRACKLEALLRLLSSKRRELRRDQMKLDNQFISLMNELQVSLMNDEDLTVVAGDTFKAKENLQVLEEKDKVEVRDNESSGHPPGSEERAAGDDFYPRKQPIPRSSTPPLEISRGGLFCASADVFRNVLPPSSNRSQQPRQPSSPVILGTYSNPYSTRTPTRNGSPRIFQSASHPSPSALSAGARAWREQRGRQASTGIDFRTGMSGHMALLSTHAHPHEYLDPKNRHSSNFRGMSNHTGLTTWKPSRTNLLAMPSFSPERPRHHHEPPNIEVSEAGPVGDGF